MDSVSDLGVRFDFKLRFSHHVNEKISKAYSVLGVIKRNFIYMDKNTFTLLYKAMARPHLEYKYKLQKSASHYNLRKFSFCSRVVNIWTSLPDSVVDADTLVLSKSRLDKHWLYQDVLYNFHSELPVTDGTGGASICM